jgi:hypothetical protein
MKGVLLLIKAKINEQAMKNIFESGAELSCPGFCSVADGVLRD